MVEDLRSYIFDEQRPRLSCDRDEEGLETTWRLET